MNRYTPALYLLVGTIPLFLLGSIAVSSPQTDFTSELLFPDASGVTGTFTTNRFVDTQNPFFQSLGTNGRACVTCHQPGDGWSVTPEHIRARFRATRGLDPIFRANDGANSPNADLSTLKSRRTACSMLLTKGLIRVGLPIPDNAEFTLDSVDDPYGYASAKELSLFRRPLPAANLRFLSTVMWDGRETVQPITGAPSDALKALQADLMSQATDATLLHAQATAPPTPRQLQQIVAFETGLYTAQVFDAEAGWLHARNALGGPRFLSQANFFIGINDPVGMNPNGAPFDPNAMTLFQSWTHRFNDHRHRARAAVARGEKLFNTRPLIIANVAGLNDRLGQPTIQGTCTLCHDTPNVGDHSVSFPLNIGVSDATRRTPDMPLYTLRNNVTGETVQTTDPGRALITGKWADIGKFKGPILRGLAARAPYFHNGSAATLEDVLDFYDQRFNANFTPQEKADLIAFLRSL